MAMIHGVLIYVDVAERHVQPIHIVNKDCAAFYFSTEDIRLIIPMFH